MTDTTRADGPLDLVWNWEFLALCSTAFARAQAGATVIIALAMYADLFQTSGTVEGLFGTAFALAQFVVVLPLGRYIDLGNAKRYLLGGLVLNAIVLVGFSLVASPVHLIVTRAFQGVAATVIWVTATAVVGEISPDDSSGLWLGTYNQIDGFFSLFGYLSGGLLLQQLGFEGSYAVLVGVTAFAAIMVVGALRDNPGGRKDPEDSTGLGMLFSLAQSTMIRALLVFRFGFSLGKMAVTIFLPIYATTAFGMNPFVVGGIMSGGKLVKTAIQGKVGDISDRTDDRYRFIVAGAAVFAFGTALIPAAGPLGSQVPAVTLAGFGRHLFLPGAFFVLFTAYTVIGIGDSLRQPVSMTLFVEEGERFGAVASSLSLRTVIWKLGEIAGPVFVGALWDLTSVLVAFWSAAGFVLVAGIALAVLAGGRSDPVGTDLDAAD